MQVGQELRESIPVEGLGSKAAEAARDVAQKLEDRVDEAERQAAQKR